MNTGSAIPEDTPAELVKAYREADQEHVFRFWGDLDEEHRRAFALQLRDIDLRTVGALARGKSTGASAPQADRQPAPVLKLGEESPTFTRAQALERGKEMLAAGKVGLYLVAGGQGSRLGFDGPKGCLPVGVLSGKTLFQLHGEKIAALSSTHGVRIPWYIMTSVANNAATRSFFEKHSYFGLRPEDVLFLPQRMLPALDDRGKLILASKGEVFMSPNGHGGAFEAFGTGGGLEDAERRGIEHLFYFQVDNPLVRLADPLFLGGHALSSSEMSLKVLRKTDPGEKVGVVAMEGQRCQMVEYSDLSEEEAKRRGADGELAYWAGSIAIHAFSLPFFRRVAAGEIRLPYHVGRKTVAAVDESGQPTRIEARKYETFVFDSLPFAQKFLNVEVCRAEEFGPVKNRTGVDSLDSAQEMLVAEHRRWLAQAGVEARARVEVSPLAALDARELQERLLLTEKAERSFTSDVHVERNAQGAVEIQTVPG